MDEPDDQIKPDHQRTYRLVLSASVIAAVVIFAGLLIYQRVNQPAPTPTATVNRILPPATPKSYTDFFGYIKAADERVLTVQMTVTDERGDRHHKNYQVSWDNSTEIVYLADINGTDLSAATIDQFQVDDLVQVFGTDDLAGISDFTATRLVKINKSSS